MGRGLLGLVRFLPFPDLERVRGGIRAGLVEARALGVTTVHESVSPVLLPFLSELHDAGELTLRFHVWGSLTPGPFGGGVDQHLALAERHGREHWITFGTLKGGVDGMPGLRTAALLAPYDDDPTTSGLLTMEPAELRTAIAAANEKGVRVALHATGDAGVARALDACAAAGDPALANRIEHAFFVAPEDAARMGRAGVIASVQPGFLAIDLAKDRFYERRLGPERTARAHPLRSLSEGGATLAFGTDHSLTPLDPMVGLYAAVTRRERWTAHRRRAGSPPSAFRSTTPCAPTRAARPWRRAPGTTRASWRPGCSPTSSSSTATSSRSRQQSCSRRACASPWSAAGSSSSAWD